MPCDRAELAVVNVSNTAIERVHAGHAAHYRAIKDVFQTFKHE